MILQSHWIILGLTSEKGEPRGVSHNPSSLENYPEVLYIQIQVRKENLYLHQKLVSCGREGITFQSQGLPDSRDDKHSGGAHEILLSHWEEHKVIIASVDPRGKKKISKSVQFGPISREKRNYSQPEIHQKKISANHHHCLKKKRYAKNVEI